MAEFAQIDQNYIVQQVIVVNDSVINNAPDARNEALGIDFINNVLHLPGSWKQTSSTGAFRKHYAGTGYTYNATIDAYVPPKPYPSWILNTLAANWDAPIPYPTDGLVYVWDEPTLSWKLLP